MSRDTPFDRPITTTEAFARTLGELLQSADANGVEIAGAWECRSDGNGTDWEVLITELAADRPGTETG